MDISKLQLSVEASNALQNLNKVEHNLNKTEKAANGLKNTLKTIGLSVGFTYLVKESLKLANSTDALNKRFNVLFNGKASNALRTLANNFSLTNRNAKELLSTAAKFGTAGGFSGNELTNFSESLSKLAADVAAFNAIDDVSSVLDRFGIATLGRTQGLREFGVQIDTTSQYFKDLVKSIQESTGASESQAKQLAILQEAQKQLAYTQGSSAEQINSGWQQLNNLFSNFKDVLAEVGGVFSKIFAPILKGLNSLLEIPFAKTVAAWGISLGVLSALLLKIIDSLKQLSKTMTNVSDIVGSNLEFNEHKANKFVNILKEANNQINKIQRLRFRKLELTGLKKKDSDEYKALWSSIISQEKKAKLLQAGLLNSLAQYAHELKDTDLSAIKVTPTIDTARAHILQMIDTYEGSNNSFIELGATLGSLGKTASNVSQTKIGPLTVILSSVGSKFSAVAASLKSFALFDLSNLKTLLSGGGAAAGIAALKGLGATLGWIAAIALSVAGIFAGIGNIVTHFSDIWKELKLTIGEIIGIFPKIGNELRYMFFNLGSELETLFNFVTFGIFKTKSAEEEKIDEIITKFKKAANIEQTLLDKIFRQIGEVITLILNKLIEFLNKIPGSRKKLPKLETIWTVEDRKIESEALTKELNKIANQTTEIRKNALLEEQGLVKQTDAEKLKILQAQLEATKSTINNIMETEAGLIVQIRDIENKIKKEGITKETFTQFDKLNSELQKVVQNRLQSSKKQKSIEEEIARLTKENQQERMEKIKSDLSLTQTAIQGVEAKSMEAIKLQSRTNDNNELKNINNLLQKRNENAEKYERESITALKGIQNKQISVPFQVVNA